MKLSLFTKVRVINNFVMLEFPSGLDIFREIYEIYFKQTSLLQMLSHINNR